jgi:mannose-1-phosphate guanylyltransferase / mannose-6-phosphate isomerase
VAELHEADADGNRLSGKGSVLRARNTFVHAPLRPVVALGTEDLVIIDTQDAVLVASIHCLEQVKEVVAQLSASGHAEATQHRRVARPWGAYDRIDAGPRFRVQRLTVKPGATLALRMHHHRAEHWVVVEGTARVTKDGETMLLRENESIYIPIGVVYRLENPGKTLLEVIEIQSGGYLGEDDIVRFDEPTNTGN